MGQVYLAYDSQLARSVAIKVLPEFFALDEERLARFIREARTASALNHPNILTVYDIGQYGELHYFATELVEGVTFRNLLDEKGVSLSLGAKIPGPRMRIRPVNMEFRYGTSFLSESPEAYERLILDAMRGDASLFTRVDEVEASWEICDPILKTWAAMPGPLPTYAAGSAGPAEADVLLDGVTSWRSI